MHTPTLISTAFTAAALIAGTAAQPIRRGSIVDDGNLPSAPSSRRGSIVADELPLSRRGSIVDLPKTPSRRGSLTPEDIVASRRRSTVEEPPARRSSLANPGDIMASRRRSLADDALPVRRSSLAQPGDIVNSRRRSLLPDEDAISPMRRNSLAAGPNDIAAARNRRSALVAEEAYEFPARRSSAAPSAADIAGAQHRTAGMESPPEGSPTRRSSLAPSPADIALSRRRSAVTPESPPEGVSRRSSAAPSPVDIALSRRRSAIVSESPLEGLSRRSSGATPSPVDIAAARRRSAAVDGGLESPTRRRSLATAQDVVSSRRRSFAASDSVPARRSSLANEVPAWRTSFGASAATDTEVVVEEEVAPEDDAPITPGLSEPAIPLFKRADNPLAESDGTINLDAAIAHLEHISIKYEKGIIAHQTNKGEPLFDAKVYTQDELNEREMRLARRSLPVEEPESLETSTDASEKDEKDLPTVEEDFMAGASEFSTGNPNIVAYKAKTSTSTKGGVNLKSYNNDLLWAGPVKIGSNSQTFILDFDTGSADTWVPSSSCTTTACNSHSKYNPSTSSTSDLVEDNTLSVQYGDGSTTTGKVYSDDLTIAGLTAHDQEFGVATALSAAFKDDPQDGIMGMGYQSISQMNVPPVFQTLMKQNRVANSQFSFSLNSGSGSELYLGGANPSKYKGSFEWHDVVSESYWVLQGSAQVNGESASSDFYAIIDTGTTVVVAPTAQAKAFWAKVEGAKPYQGGYYTFPCDNVPEVSFSFGGKEWPMSSDNLNLGAVSAGSSQCVGSIVGLDVGVSAWIIGDAFLKDVYTTFDFEENRVGFAEKA